MPILVDRGGDGCRIILGQGCDREPSGARPDEIGADWIEIGVINNMPDSALEATEQQFLNLLAAAAEHRWCRVRFFSLPGVVRSQRGRDLTASYSDIGELLDSDLDGLI